MKKLLPLLLLFSCHQPNDQKIIARLDSLEQQVKQAYHPGFGEFMSSIQMHHAKLWFAGNAQNWRLADFEIHEIGEALDNLKTYVTDRKETASLGILTPGIDSVNKAIEAKNLSSFQSAYLFMTNKCNTCHDEVNYPFNKVKVPDSPPLSNQDFKE